MASCETDGHLYRSESSACIMCGHEKEKGGCMPLTREEADALWKMATKQQEDRARYMPNIEAALTLMTQAHHRLKELGWREAMYCPKDGTNFEVIEAGSSGIHVCHYHGEWPNGWWISDAGDLWPSHPILWRPIAK